MAKRRRSSHPREDIPKHERRSIIGQSAKKGRRSNKKHHQGVNGWALSRMEAKAAK